MSDDCLMVHSISSSTLRNAMRFSHHSVQGHYHGNFGIEWFGDVKKSRWSMSVGCLMDPESSAARYGRSQVFKVPILGCGLIVSDQGNTLILPDIHFPYHHKDTFDFLGSLSDYYNPERVFCVGDIFDNHRPSYHESEGDSLSEEDEYLLAKSNAHDLKELFPQMVIARGNHDDLPVRKAKSAKLPVSMLSDMNALYDLGDGWSWVHEHYFDSWGGDPIVIPFHRNKRGRWAKTFTRL